MAKIVIFDSGFGSLSVIRAIQKSTKSEIIYFADQINFPYGKKTKSQLFSIVTQTIDLLKNKFNPEFIVVGSNTPTLLLEKITRTAIVIIGDVIKPKSYKFSRLYDKTFSHGFRKAKIAVKTKN